MQPTWMIYLEEADSDEPRKYLGTINANTMAEALQKASEYWEVPSHDLVAIGIGHSQGQVGTGL